MRHDNVMSMFGEMYLTPKAKHQTQLKLLLCVDLCFIQFTYSLIIRQGGEYESRELHHKGLVRKKHAVPDTALQFDVPLCQGLFKEG